MAAASGWRFSRRAGEPRVCVWRHAEGARRRVCSDGPRGAPTAPPSAGPSKPCTVARIRGSSWAPELQPAVGPCLACLPCLPPEATRENRQHSMSPCDQRPNCVVLHRLAPPREPASPLPSVACGLTWYVGGTSGPPLRLSPPLHRAQMLEPKAREELARYSESDSEAKAIKQRLQSQVRAGARCPLPHESAPAARRAQARPSSGATRRPPLDVPADFASDPGGSGCEWRAARRGCWEAPAAGDWARCAASPRHRATATA